ncbi:MAG: hypothetical protein V1648_01530 [Candidatus Aenigmatarchaeota archaeon]
MGWKRDKNLIAERFGRDELPGFLHKEFEASGGESVILEKDGEIYMEKGHGKLVISNVLEDFTDIIMVDKSEKTLANDIKNVCTLDGRAMTIGLTLKFRVFNSDHFSKNLMCERDKVFLSDVWDQTMSDVMCGRILPKLQKKSASEFAGPGFADKARSSMEDEIRKKFKSWGLLLTSLYAKFTIPSDACGADETAESATCPIAQPARKADLTEDDDVETLDKERLEREVEMELQKKQTQKDMADALEAMDLKDIQEKKKKLRDGAANDERQKLIEDLQNLRKAKEITERKFYKKELSEEAFQHMMEDFEKRIIEIETKLGRKK